MIQFHTTLTRWGKTAAIQTINQYQSYWWAVLCPNRLIELPKRPNLSGGFRVRSSYDPSDPSGTFEIAFHVGNLPSDARSRHMMAYVDYFPHSFPLIATKTRATWE